MRCPWHRLWKVSRTGRGRIRVEPMVLERWFRRQPLVRVERQHLRKERNKGVE